jgi:acetoin utilization deacetylase AcuC-like enzyme
MTARTGLVTHERYFWHDTSGSVARAQASAFEQPTRHYEHPDTKRRMLGLLEVSGLLGQLLRIAPREATIDELRRFHTSAYIDRVRVLSAGDRRRGGEAAPVGHGSLRSRCLPSAAASPRAMP